MAEEREVITIDVPEPTTTPLISYQYYGSSDEGDNLARLNKLPSVDVKPGKFKIFKP